MRSLLLTLITLAVLAGCSSGTLKEAPEPLPAEIPAQVRMNIDWWQILGEFHAEVPFHRIAPRVTEQGILTASPFGEVVLLSEQGEFIWRRQVADQITAPPASDQRHMSVVTGNGDVLLLDWDGNVEWSTAVSALATEAPVLLEDRLILQTTDGRVMALERNTGRALWAYQDAEPDLTITGTARPTVLDDLVITGFASGKLVALNVADGTPAWEYRIARAQGKTDISRLVDVDASVTPVGDGLIVAAGYQGDILVIDAASGRVMASRPFSTYNAVVPGDRYWYAVNDESHVMALDPQTLDTVWEQGQFTYRRLSKVVIWRDALAVSDGLGYVHLLDADTGEWLNSRQVDWRGVNTAPVLMGDYLLQYGNSSRIKRLSFERQAE